MKTGKSEIDESVFKKRMWELAQSGKSAGEIMRELDISEISVLKNGLQELMAEKGKTITVPGLIGEPATEGRYTDSGERIPPEMLDPPEK